MIEVKNLTKSFSRHKVLDRLDLTVKTSETLVIIGRSGGGKSVLLKHMIGLIKPDSGHVLVDGVDIAPMTEDQVGKMRLRFGFLFQNAALFDSMTTFENVAFPLVEHTRMTPDEVKQRVHECLNLVGLPNADNLYPAELSGGMRKRVGLARALSINPEYILYDEPTTGIDPIMGDIINDLIIALRDRLKVTSVVVTHDMRSAYKVADRIAMLYNGGIIEVGTPDEIRNSKNPVVQQFIKGEAVGPIQEGLPDRKVLTRWDARGSRSRFH
jgi:phospholipid/cholesterol/gamma-HCH transport system ATP-binding protein